VLCSIEPLTVTLLVALVNEQKKNMISIICALLAAVQINQQARPACNHQTVGPTLQSICSVKKTQENTTLSTYPALAVA
jgi:hypothetical protein